MLPHAIGRQALEIQVSTESQALPLLDRIGELNHRSLIPTIARVLDEFDEPGLLVSIDHLDLDIGTIPATRLELAAERLEAELRGALARALGGAGRLAGAGPSNAPAVVPAAAALLDVLAKYLLRGTWSYRWDDELGDPATLLSTAMETQPAAFVQLVHRHSEHPEFAARLASQMALTDLERLLHLLNPQNAAKILNTMRELSTHRVRTIASLSEVSFTRLLWPLVLRQVLTEANAVSDAQTFERKLLANAAGLLGEGDTGPTFLVPAEDGILSMGDLPEEFGAHDMWPDAPTATARDRAPIDLFEHFLLRGSWIGMKPEALMLLLADIEPEALVRLFRRHSANDAVLRRVTEIMSTAALSRLLEVLEPEAASAMVDYILEMRALHRSEPIAPLSDPALERLLWYITLRHVLRESGTQFNRRSFVAALIEDVAIEEGLSYDEVLAALSLGVQEMAKAHPVATSLPAIINDLAAALEPADSHAAAVSQLERLLRQGVQASAAELRRVVEAARTQDPLGLQRLLRWYAKHDPARLIATVGAAFSTPLLVKLLLYGDAAERVVAIIVRLGGTPAGRGMPAHQRDIAIVRAIASFDRVPADGALLARIVQSVAEAAHVAPAQLAASLAANGEGTDGSFEVDLSGRDPTEFQSTHAFDARAYAASTDTAATLYASLDQFRHFLRTGFLPWRDVVAEPTLTPRRLLESLECIRPSIVRAAVAGMQLDRRALSRALASLGETEIARLIEWLLPDDAAARELQHAIAVPAANTLDRTAFQTEAIAAFAAARAVDFEAVRAIRADTDIAVVDKTVDQMLALLAQGIGKRAAVPANWTELLVRLATRDRRSARRFLTTVAAGPTGLSRLGELCALPLLGTLLAALVPAAASTLIALSESLTGYSTRHGPGEQAITEAILGEALSIEPDIGPGFALVARVLQSLFGDTLPKARMPALRRDLLSRLPRDVAAAVAAAMAHAKSTRARNAASLPARSGARSVEVRRTGAEDGERALLGRGGPPGEEVATSQSEYQQPEESAEISPRLQQREPANEGAEEWLRADFGDAAAARQQGAHTEWLFRALAGRDLSRASPGMEVPELLGELLAQLLQTPSSALAIRLVGFLHQSRNRADLIPLLPERLLARLIAHAVPHIGRDSLDAGELLVEAAGAEGAPLDRTMLWQALFATAAAPAGQRTIARLAEHVFTMAGRAADGAQAKQRDPAEALLHAVAQRARDAGHAALLAALAERRGQLVASYAGRRAGVAAQPERVTARAKPQVRPIRTRTAFRLGSDDSALKGEPIYIGNAGLVLANPFLPQIFDMLDLMVRGENGKLALRDEAAASRGVHLLQYLVDGRTDRPEPLLVLNKLLCGLPVATPVERAIESTGAEREACETLLRSMIENWPIVRGTSLAGLRETFLQREGKLTLGDGGWRLQVQRKTLDVLVDELPWSIGVVFHPWMRSPLHVTW